MKILLLVSMLLLLLLRRIAMLLELERMNYRIMNQILGVVLWVLRNYCFRRERCLVERGLLKIVQRCFQLERRVLHVSYNLSIRLS